MADEINFNINTVDGLINHLIEHTSIKQQLEKYHIYLNFEKTDDSVNVDLENYTVRVGDSFRSKLNQLISQAKPPVGDDIKEKFDYRYHLKKKRIVSKENKKNFNTYLQYGWSKTPKPDNEDANKDQQQTAKDMFDNSQHIGYLIWRTDPQSTTESKYENAPASVSSGKYNKTVLSLNIDLKVFDHLHALLSSEMSETVSKFTDKQWDMMRDRIQHEIGQGKSTEELMEMELMQDRTGWFGDTINRFKNAFGGDILVQSGKENDEAFQEREKIWEELQEGMKEISDTYTTAESTMRSLVKQFSFQATATILGDPAFGTTIEPYSAYFISNFETIGNFSDFLNGIPWIFKKAKHKFDSDGTYKTELELQTVPILPDNDGVDVKQVNKNMSNRWALRAKQYQERNS